MLALVKDHNNHKNKFQILIYHPKPVEKVENIRNKASVMELKKHVKDVPLHGLINETPENPRRLHRQEWTVKIKVQNHHGIKMEKENTYQKD
ncbi:11529_t:CDS:2 [Gigaspora margarita]|uniref:11529_t:CDS:1 n=1 Tax=Gigaspora margarita TaxID=4874 RepID=A0ABM8W3J5_GIGMA|nr:11529_t:CDS:2 [Gigaspora margarita]